MSKHIRREFYLLPRGEQRALILLSLLLILSLGFRIVIGLLPEKEPEGLDEFRREAIRLAAILAESDSIKKSRKDSLLQKPMDKRPMASSSSIRKQRTYSAQPVNINLVDSADLLPLPGIGPVFAGRIIKYRRLLGGYLSVDQLNEVYGISSETVQKIRDQVYIDSLAIRKIRIDSASFRELLRHPYLEYEDVKSLLEYRNYKGDINSGDELRTNHILSDSSLRKIDGYFDYR